MPVQLQNLDIHGFFNGVNVDGGKALVQGGMSVHDNNGNGLQIGGGHVVITVTGASATPTIFTANGNGIHETGDAASVLIATAGEDGSGNSLIRASGNLGAGLRIYSPDASNALTGVAANNNGGSGLAVYAGARVKVRSSRFKSNGTAGTGSGIRIKPNGSATDLSGIDLGASAASDPGLNSFASNGDAAICVMVVDNAPVLARGNIFGSVDCSLPAGGNVELHSGTCDGVNGIGSQGGLPIPVAANYCTLVLQ